MITYDRLWETMKKKEISQYRLIKYYGVSAGQIGRLKKNMYVSTHTINVLCTILDCTVDDIMEYRVDPNEPFYVIPNKPSRGVTGLIELGLTSPSRD